MFEWLFLLFTPVAADVPKEDYIGVVAAEAAYVAMEPEKPVDNRVDRKDCKVCNGTGQVRSGDGQGWSKCPNCKPPAGALKLETAPTETPPAMKLQVKPLPAPKTGNCQSGTCSLS